MTTKVLSSDQIKTAIWTAIKSKTNKSNHETNKACGPWIEDILFEHNLEYNQNLDYSQDAVNKVLANTEQLNSLIYSLKEPSQPETETIYVDEFTKKDINLYDETTTTITVNITEREVADFNTILPNLRIFQQGVDNKQSALLDAYDIMYEPSITSKSNDIYFASKYYPNVYYKFNTTEKPQAYYLQNSQYIELYTFGSDSLGYSTKTEILSSCDFDMPFVINKIYFNNKLYNIVDNQGNEAKYPNQN